MAATPPRERAVLDSAHVGDIQGAFGTISQHDTAARRSWRARALTLAAIIGPGLIVMVGDNDAGGVATYSQAGQTYGTSLLWVLLLDRKSTRLNSSHLGISYAVFCLKKK